MSFPPTQPQPVVDQYHGISVEDPYRWLESSSDPAVRAWVQSQNEHTRAYLDQIPFRARVSEQIRRLRGASSPENFGLA